MLTGIAINYIKNSNFLNIRVFIYVQEENKTHTTHYLNKNIKL